jgi:hypothetical protein
MTSSHDGYVNIEQDQKDKSKTIFITVPDPPPTQTSLQIQVHLFQQKFFRDKNPSYVVNLTIFLHETVEEIEQRIKNELNRIDPTLKFQFLFWTGSSFSELGTVININNTTFRIVCDQRVQRFGNVVRGSFVLKRD